MIYSTLTLSACLRVQNTARICTSAILFFFVIIQGKLYWRISPLVRYEILGLFLNTLTADDKLSRQNKEHLHELIQVQLSCQFFIAFMELTSNFEHFFKKDNPQRLSISEIMDTKKCVYLNIQKTLFQDILTQSLCLGSKTLFKSARQHIFLVLPSF